MLVALHHHGTLRNIDEHFVFVVDCFCMYAHTRYTLSLFTSALLYTVLVCVWLCYCCDPILLFQSSRSSLFSTGGICHSDCGLLAYLLTYLLGWLMSTQNLYSPMQLGPWGCGLSEPQLIAISSSWAYKIILGKALALWPQISLSLSSIYLRSSLTSQLKIA